ncbi:hypothetical protein F5X98DRAFT_243694 [Xylaria grammica]|nr:hypothetical protein F5X98DRAFT_243694 [Xylaria grammica]
MNPAILPFRPRQGQDSLGRAFPPNPQDSRSQVDCKFYQSGSCRNGHNCRFRHQVSSGPVVNPIARPPTVRHPNEILGTVDDYPRTMCNRLKRRLLAPSAARWRTLKMALLSLRFYSRPISLLSNSPDFRTRVLPRLCKVSSSLERSTPLR